MDALEEGLENQMVLPSLAYRSIGASLSSKAGSLLLSVLVVKGERKKL